MKFSKKILAAVLAALMAISMMPITVFATTYDSGKVDIDNLREGDIITTSVNKIIGLGEFSLTLQAGGYGSDGGNAENTDLRISWPEFRDGSVFDEEVNYYPFDENGNQSDTWYVVALDHGWDTITLSGIAPAPLKATFTGNLVDTFETGIMNKFIGGDELDYDTTPVQKDREYEISRGVDDYGLVVVVSVPGNAAFDPADISFTIGETVSRPVSDDDNDDRSAAVWYYPPDETDDPKVYEFFVTKAAFTDSMVVDYTPSTPAEPAEEPTVTWYAATENIQIGEDCDQSNPYDASYTKDAITVSATSEEGHTYIDGTRFSEAFMGDLSGFVFTNSVANFSKIKLVFTGLSIAGYNQFFDSEYNVDPHWSSDLDSKTVTWEGDSNSVGLYAYNVTGTLDRIEFTYEEPAPSAYAGYVPAEADDATALAAKVVKFNGYDWYMIEDNSTSETEGTVTLFAKECVGASAFGTNNTYSGSTVKGELDKLTAEGGSFAGVSGAIESVKVKGVDSDSEVDAKLWLLSSGEANNIPVNVRMCSQASEAIGNAWWLRSAYSDGTIAEFVMGSNGYVANGGTGFSVNQSFGVRPALKLDLSKVEFNSETKTFAPPAPTEPNNGASISVAETISENFYLDDEFYGEDSFITVNYNHNSNVSETEDFRTDVVAMNSLPELNDSTSEYNGARKFSVVQAPAQITEEVTITVYASQADAQAGTNAIDTITTSTYDYCRAIIEGDYAANLKALAKSTLDYAAAAQLFFNYNTDEMATKDNANNAFYGDVAGADLSSVAGPGALATGIEQVSVVVKSDLEINLLSRNKINVTDYNLDTTKGGTRFKATSVEEKNGDFYVIHIEGIEPDNMDNTITVNTDCGDIVMTANSVMRAMAGSSDEKMVTLAKAMYLYGVAANNYFA